MADSINKKIPNQIVVSLEVKRAIEDESVRLTRIEGQRVTQGDVVGRAWDLLKKYEGALPIDSRDRPPERVYNLQIVTQKSREVIDIMGQIMTELSKAGKQSVGTDSETDALIAGARAKTRELTGRVAEATERIQEPGAEPGKTKRSPHPKVSGGAA